MPRVTDDQSSDGRGPVTEFTSVKLICQSRVPSPPYTHERTRTTYITYTLCRRRSWHVTVGGRKVVRIVYRIERRAGLERIPNDFPYRTDAIKRITAKNIGEARQSAADNKCIKNRWLPSSGRSRRVIYEGSREPGRVLELRFRRTVVDRKTIRVIIRVIVPRWSNPVIRTNISAIENRIR